MTGGWKISDTLKRQLFRFLEAVFASSRGERMLSRAVEPMTSRNATELGLTLTPAPYDDLGAAPLNATNLRDDPIFITARFRSGSTFLWNLFRNIPGATAYYEPFNERRWFDPATRGETVDESHRQVDDYWREYEGLEELKDLYREAWINRRLYMDDHAWDPHMRRYVELLIERAPGRPVLQFNRIDFRLPWFKKTFPHAKLVHLYRHPRDQWCSTLWSQQPYRPGLPSSTFVDHFYLHVWTSDLQTHFPFLRGEDRNPYELFYLIWRMSYLFGQRYADYSLSYETLLEAPEQTLTDMFQAVRYDHVDLGPLLKLFSPPQLGKWKSFAEDAWFARIEANCEAMLRDFFAASTAATTHSGEFASAIARE